MTRRVRMLAGALIVAGVVEPSSTIAQVAGAAAFGGEAIGETAVGEQGATRIVGPASGSPTLAAVILTRRATAAEAQADRATRCSGGRTVCSLVDRLTLTVDGRRVEVPPRALLPLADVDTARLLRLGVGRYELLLTGGDAAPAYQARLFFDRRRVTRLDLWSDEAGTVEQHTTFTDLSHAFR